MTTTTRERLILSATPLFAERGFAIVTVNDIINAAGATRPEFDTLFASKDELALACLRRHTLRWEEELPIRLDTIGARTARDRLASMLDIWLGWQLESGRCGLLVAHASADYGPETHPCRVAAQESLNALYDYLHNLADRAGARDAGALASELTMHMYGILLTSFASTERGVESAALRWAKLLVDAWLTPARSPDAPARELARAG